MDKLQEILTDSNIQKFDHPDKALLEDLRRASGDFLEYVHDARWRERIESFNAKANYLSSLATVVCYHSLCQRYPSLFLDTQSTFLGAVQITFIAYSATVALNGTIGQVVNFFSYCAMSFDAFGAISSLFTSGSLLSTTSQAKALASQALDDETRYQLVAFIKLCNHRDASKKLQLNKNMRMCFKKFSGDCDLKYEEAKRLAFVIDHHLRKVFEAIWVIIAGVVFFFISFITFIIGTQPEDIFVSSIAVVGVTAIVLLYRQARRHPGIRRNLSKAWHSALKSALHRSSTAQEESQSVSELLNLPSTTGVDPGLQEHQEYHSIFGEGQSHAFAPNNSSAESQVDKGKRREMEAQFVTNWNSADPQSRPHKPGLDVLPAISNLGSSYTRRFQRTADPQDIDYATVQHVNAEFSLSGHAELPSYLEVR